MVEEIKQEGKDEQIGLDKPDIDLAGISIAPRRDPLDMAKLLIDANLASAYQTMKVAEQEPAKQFWSYGEDKPLRSFLGEDNTVDATADDDSDEEDEKIDVRDDFEDEDDAAVEVTGQPVNLMEQTKEERMSKEELQQIVERQQREIQKLTKKVKEYQEEKELIVNNFKQSTSVLLERIKDLESQQTLGHERPQTAYVLENISK